VNQFRTAAREYVTDDQGFLLDPDSWHEDFAETMARGLKIEGGLTAKHWEVLRTIRDFYRERGKCPSVYETCRAAGLSLDDLKRYFPTGYLRGACKLAGLTYREAYLKYSWAEASHRQQQDTPGTKTYRVDVRGFLLDPLDWDASFAIHRAHDCKMRGGLSEDHWRIISYLRERFELTGSVPSVHETCEANQIGLGELERLFPEGYHRCAVRIAGLRVL
jgi:tRNA 2-thiouridine synthesizing protein E